MAGKIPQSFIDDLLERTDIVDIIDSRVKLKKTGRNYQACCPFHDEKTPSFSVSPDKQFYYCFGCGAGGNVISFLMDYDRSDFVETIDKLAQTHGLEVPREESAESARQQKTRRSIYDLLEQASHYYQQQLRNHAQKEKATQYLKQRGLTGEIAKQFGIGYAPPGWDNVKNALGDNHEHLQLLMESGMLVEKENGSGYYDRFRDRLMFPIRDNRGRTIAFGGRVLNDEKPKYLNSPETPVFHKQYELYGLYEARQANKHLERLIMVEGYMDVVALAQFGINWAVATLGTSAGPAHMEKVFRHTNEIIFCFDGDEAGRKAAGRALESVLPLMQSGRQARFLFLPEGEDPDSLIRNIGKDQFLFRIEQSQTLSEYLFDIHTQGLDLARTDDRAKLISNIMPDINQIPVSPFRELVLRKLSESSGLPIDEIKRYENLASEEAARQDHTATNNPAESSAPGPARREKLSLEFQRVKRTPVRTALAILIMEPELAHEDIDPGLFETEEDEELALFAELLHYIRANEDITTAKILGHWLAKHREAMTRLLSIEMNNDNPEALREEFRDAIDHLLSSSWKKEKQSIIEILKSDPNKGIEALSSQEQEAFLAIFNRKK